MAVYDPYKHNPGPQLSRWSLKSNSKATTKVDPARGSLTTPEGSRLESTHGTSRNEKSEKVKENGTKGVGNQILMAGER